MKVIADAFGGDNAPLEILKGCADAVKELGVEIIAVGKENEIKKCASENGISLENITIHDAPDVMKMTDDPLGIRHASNQTSMAIGLRMLAAGEGDAFVSAGSTGALVVGGTFIVKRIKGIKRAAIASVMPSEKQPFMLIDSGANLDCTPETLVQFATMGNIYMHNILGVASPRIGLANIGTEETKGTPLYVEAYKLLKECDFNFIGNAEVRDIPAGVCDVVVADGFTGNVILKMYEGVASSIAHRVSALFKKNAVSKLAAALVMGGIKDFKKQMDYKEFGGAPLMGLRKPVIKAHGSSDARAFKNAVRQAKDFSEKGVISQIEALVEKEKTEAAE
ncbi:MAG: phosphate acyltransferase PlsX [Clostridiales bacterium]|nr:phosphate acyltransferase PlsX [Clostridiales bacterium]